MPRKRTPHDRPRGQPWTEADVQRIVMNPFYAITVDDRLSEPHEPMMPRDQWVAMNVRLINELGPQRYLEELLRLLEGQFPASVDNPYPYGYMPGSPRRRGH